MNYITLEYDNGTKLKALCGAIVTCDEDGSNTNVNCIHLNAEVLDNLEGIYIPKHGEAKVIRKENERWEVK